MVGHDHAMLYVPLCGTPVYFSHTGVLFSGTNAVPFYKIPFQNKITNAIILEYEMHVHSCPYTHI
jgi:hypothetical protein